MTDRPLVEQTLGPHRFNPGDRVRLLPQPEDGAPDEELLGTIIEYEGSQLYMVQVDEQFRDNDLTPLDDFQTFDDGLREVMDEHLAPLDRGEDPLHRARGGRLPEGCEAPEVTQARQWLDLDSRELDSLGRRHVGVLLERVVRLEAALVERQRAGDALADTGVNGRGFAAAREAWRALPDWRRP